MSDAARLARDAFKLKPKNTSYTSYTINSNQSQIVFSSLDRAIIDSAYSSVISYLEALNGLKKKSYSWSIVKLYYCSFYSIRCHLLINRVIPFHCDGEKILDLVSNRFYKGGSSSHHWNWDGLRKIKTISKPWFISEDSEQAYCSLRSHRDSINYTHEFTDPHLHKSLITNVTDFSVRVKSYKEDDNFTYTYLTDHLTLAYPTKLIFELDSALQKLQLKLNDDQIKHIKLNFNSNIRCPFL